MNKCTSKQGPLAKKIQKLKSDLKKCNDCLSKYKCFHDTIIQLIPKGLHQSFPDGTTMFSINNFIVVPDPIPDCIESILFNILIFKINSNGIGANLILDMNGITASTPFPIVQPNAGLYVVGIRPTFNYKNNKCVDPSLGDYTITYSFNIQPITIT